MSLAEDRDTPWAVVAAILEEGYSVVINRGSRDGVKQGQKFLIYEISPDEVRDPISGESLGHLEIVKGTGDVSHLQEKMATITSNRRTTSSRFMFQQPVLSLEPFKSPKIGDRARPI
jgi:hypothetical protein